MRRIFYDFNNPPDERGYYSVILNLDEVQRGDEVVLDDEEGFTVNGRVLYVLAVVERTGEIESYDKQS